MSSPPVRVSFRTPPRAAATPIAAGGPAGVTARPPGRRPGRPPWRRAPIGRVRPGNLTGEDIWIIAMLTAAVMIAIGAAVEDPMAVDDRARANAPVSAAPAGGGCTVADPTGTGGCVTPATAHALEEIVRIFGAYRQGPAIRAASCWDAHRWNPTSDHPKGRACDLYTGPARAVAAGKALDDGNALVGWLRANAGPLQVAYVIWQGRIWSPERGERRYSGGGIYDPTDPVGGHYDHIHISFRR